MASPSTRSIGELLDGGKRLLLLSGRDYGPIMHPLIFLKCVLAPHCSLPFNFGHSFSFSKYLLCRPGRWRCGH